LEARQNLPVQPVKLADRAILPGVFPNNTSGYYGYLPEQRP